MTRHDYELLSAALADCRPDQRSQQDYYWGWLSACQAIGEALKRQSSGFNEDQFLTDCGYHKHV